MTISLPVIDLSQLPPPDAIKGLNYETIIAARKADLVARFTAAGIAYDVATLETDPGVILQEVDAYRELLDKGAINDSVRAVLPAFAQTSNLDAICARANDIRLQIDPGDPANGIAPTYESDAALLQRYLASYAAPAAGSEDGYIYRVATAWPAVQDVRVMGPGVDDVRGRVRIILLAAAGAVIGDDIISAVYSALQAKDARPLTDDVTVEAAIVNRWNCTAKLTIRSGPAPSLITQRAEAALRIIAANRYYIGGALPLNAVSAPLYVANVVKVEMMAPTADIVAQDGVAPYLDTVTLTTDLADPAVISNRGSVFDGGTF
jgi:phage-related baseplate assembly protein